jgi:bisphosphoglycerate-dependent phosphoglycerate mutase
MTIYIIRHGNSLHNKPTDLKSQDERFDSSLTPLGFYQAKILAKKIDEIKDSNIILCGSFLERTQLTGLLILDNLGLLNINTPKLSAGKDLMKDRANKRFEKAGKGIDQFKEFSPINNDKDIFDDFIHSIGYTNPNSSVINSLGGKKKRRSKTKKRFSKRTKKSQKKYKK